MANGRRAPTLLATALVGALALYLGVPRLVAALTALPETPTLDAIRKGQSVEPAALRRLAASRRAASRWVDDGQLLTDQALALLLNDAGSDRAIALLEEGLARKPLNTHAWVRLALARLRRDGPGPAVLAALRQSIYTGPNAGGLSFPRIAMLLRHRPLGADMEAMLAQQIRLAWRADRKRLVALAMDSGTPLLFSQALARDPEALIAFERALRARGARDGKR